MILKINYTLFSPETVATSDPVLSFGEPGTDGEVLKIGQGVLPWSQLPSYPMPLKGEIPEGIDPRYVVAVNDPLCGNKYDRPIAE